MFCVCSTVLLQIVNLCVCTWTSKSANERGLQQRYITTGSGDLSDRGVTRGHGEGGGDISTEIEKTGTWPVAAGSSQSSLQIVSCLIWSLYIRLHLTPKFLHRIVLGTVCVLRAPPTPEVQLLTDTVNEPHNQEQSGEERGHLVYTLSRCMWL